MSFANPPGIPIPHTRIDEYILRLEDRIKVLEKKLEKFENDFYMESIILNGTKDKRDN